MLHPEDRNVWGLEESWLAIFKGLVVFTDSWICLPPQNGGTFTIEQTEIRFF